MIKKNMLLSIIINQNFCYSLKCPIRRGPSVLWAYGHTGDERLFEADYEDIVFETDSKWQNIKIAKSREFGNVLLLDDDISKIA